MSDSESIFQQQFGECHGYDGCCSTYFDSSTIVRLMFTIKSRMTIFGLAGVIILQKRADIDKMDYHMFQRKYLLRCLGKLGEV